MAAHQKEVDWEGIEIAYRAGVKSIITIAKEYSKDGVKITDAGIRKRAAKEGWIRDLQDKIREEAQAKIEMTVARAAGKAKTEREVIEVNAEIQKDIILTHRSDIGRARGLTIQMLEELEAVTNSKELIAQLSELLHSPDEDGVNKAADALRKVMSLGGRATTLKTLVDAIKSLIPLEREAFGVDDRKSETSTIDDAVKRAMSRGD